MNSRSRRCRHATVREARATLHNERSFDRGRKQHMSKSNRTFPAALIAAAGVVFALGCEASADSSPSSTPAATTQSPAAPTAAAADAKDIVDTAVAAGSFKTLAAALKAAGLVDTLKGAGPFTVFAPTDEAFAK